ncbi:hypothetical protein F4861DRAFT_1703 [Xylaria intraflava]|nr:hypothetical protein F4861DRAFT_1703 [Xylaria intraflava]
MYVLIAPYPGSRILLLRLAIFLFLSLFLLLFVFPFFALRSSCSSSSSSQRCPWAQEPYGGMALHHATQRRRRSHQLQVLTRDTSSMPWNDSVLCRLLRKRSRFRRPMGSLG